MTAKRPGRRKTSVIILLGNQATEAVTVVSNLVLVPLYLSYIGPELYGYWLASGGILAWLGLLDFGLSAVVKQRCAQAYGQDDFGRACVYYSHGMAGHLLAAALIVGAAALANAALCPLLRVPAGFCTVVSGAFLLAAVGLGLGILRAGVSAFCLALQRPTIPAAASFVGQVIRLAVCLALLNAGYGLYAIPLATLARELLVLLWLAVHSYVLFRRLGGRFRWDGAVARDYLRVGPAVVLAKVGGQGCRRLEPTLITLFFTPELTTAYVITLRMADIMQGILNGARAALLPTFSHLHGTGETGKSARVYALILQLFFWAGTICMGVYVAANHGFVELWVSAETFAGLEITLLLAVGVLATVMADIAGVLMISMGAIASASLVKGAEGLVRIALAAVLIPYAGLASLPIAAAVASLLSFGYLIKRSRSLLDQEDLRLKELAAQLVPAGAVLTFAYVVAMNGWATAAWLDILGWAGLTGAAGFAAAVACSGMLRAELRHLARRPVAAWRGRA